MTQLAALMMGLFAHPLIRGGSPRAPLRASIAAGIFASMGPATLLAQLGLFTELRDAVEAQRGALK